MEISSFFIFSKKRNKLSQFFNRKATRCHGTAGNIWNSIQINLNSVIISLNKFCCVNKFLIKVLFLSDFYTVIGSVTYTVICFFDNIQYAFGSVVFMKAK